MQTTIKNSDGKKIINSSEWDTRMSQISIDKQDINKIVLNYLIIEGFKEAAEEFMKESGLEETSNEFGSLDFGSIEYRLRVRQAIQQGEIETAVQELNNFDPEILDSSPNVYFHLKLQEFLERVRSLRAKPPGASGEEDNITEIMEIIEFARENLAPVAVEQAGGAFLEELEDAMSLLAAEIGAQWPSDALLQNEQRLKTAKEVNAAILSSQAQPELSKLPEIIALLTWAQEKLTNRAIFPKLVDPVAGTFESSEAK